MVTESAICIYTISYRTIVSFQNIKNGFIGWVRFTFETKCFYNFQILRLVIFTVTDRKTCGFENELIVLALQP